ncbi:vezatin isoform X2 [Denticeps clupeoides]|uniref:vezatin isoform X2 n=1 Tax=Denticeps clupeoides TaxID=299321 RepID=UPI0010A48981|nr:vezatin isoform X2 [Denticeps clupeoides]
MTEEFDEDVVYENSPLFQYLQDLGHTDFETCALVSQEDDRAGEEGKRLQDVLSHQKGNWARKLAEGLHRLSQFYHGNATLQHDQRLDSEFRRYALCCVLSQDVLLQEDIELIELLDPSILSLGSTTSACPRADTALPRPCFLSKPTIWDVSVLVLLLAVLSAVWCAGDDSGAPLLGGVLCVCLLFCSCVLWCRAQKQTCVWEQAVCIEKLVTDSRTLTSMCRKALRLVQETEVIYRGFTLLLDRVSAACPFNRAGSPRAQQLIGLRKVAYQSLRSVFRASRLATCIMLKSFPLNSEMDNVVNYVSTVPIKELGLGLGAEHLSEEQVQELTDDYSLPALKMLFQLWVGQSSEFFRRLALLLSPGRQEQDSRLIIHQAIATVTGPLHHTLASCLGDLQRSYDFHRYFETQLQSQSSRIHSHKQQKCHELNTLHASVHSLQLHLKTILNEMIILEDDLEKLMVAQETVSVTVTGYQELQERLRLLHPHMQASGSLWDDTLAQVDKMINRATNCTGTPDSSEEAPPTVLPPPVHPVTLIHDSDPVPEEQELEAYVSDSDSEPDLCGLHSPWEREKLRQGAEESKRVLLELKSVLGFRASEQERHKRQVLLFNEQAAVKPTAEEASEHQEQADSTEPNPAKLTSEERNDEDDQMNDMGRSSHLEENDNVTEFICGSSDTAAPGPEDTGRERENGEVQLFQYDGVSGGGVAGDSPHPASQSIPAMTVMDRLTELHGAEAISFSLALAAQVAARSHTFTHMQEHTFGDSDEDVYEGEEEEVKGDEVTSEKMGHEEEN